MPKKTIMKEVSNMERQKYSSPILDIVYLDYTDILFFSPQGDDNDIPWGQQGGDFE